MHPLPGFLDVITQDGQISCKAAMTRWTASLHASQLEALHSRPSCSPCSAAWSVELAPVIETVQGMRHLCYL
jgi:hypothetical protein